MVTASSIGLKIVETGCAATAGMTKSKRSTLMPSAGLKHCEMIIDRDDYIADERLDHGVTCAPSMLHAYLSDAGTRGTMRWAGVWCGGAPGQIRRESAAAGNRDCRLLDRTDSFVIHHVRLT
jgi:hypothetical protein